MGFLQSFPRKGSGGSSSGVTSFNNRTGAVIPQAGDYTKTDVGLGNVDNTADLDKPVSTATQTELNKKINATEKGAANGVAGLDANGKIPSSQLPTFSEVAFSGDYNDLSNTPTLGTASALDAATSGDATSNQVVKGNDSRLSDSRPASDVSEWAKAATKPEYTASEVGAIPATEKAAINGVATLGADGKVPASQLPTGGADGLATLDENGKVPSSQLPSYVDDVIEGYYDSTTDRFYEESTFTTVIAPVAGKSWVDIPANKSYRWTGTVYVRVDEGVQLGETSNSAYRGDRGKDAYDHSQLTSGNPHNVTASDVGLGNVDNTADEDKPISTAMRTALNSKADDSDVVHTTGNETVAGNKTFTGNVICTNPITVGGADYAEKFKAAEEIPNYRFVTLDGEEVKLAQKDDYIAGVTSGNPGIIGNTLLTDSTVVGLIGKLWVEQDGTAEVNGFVTNGDLGIATKAAASGYRVMAVSGNKCKILLK